MIGIITLILLGLCFGSFVNALVWRLYMQSEEETESSKQASEKKKPKKPRSSELKARYSILHGRSMCVHCKHELGALDLIPVFSWLYLRGKCRYCHKLISWQYPLVEISTAVLFVVSYIYWPYVFDGISSYAAFLLWLVMLTGFMALIVYDIRWMLLPNQIVFFLYTVVALYSAILFTESPSVSFLMDIVMGIAIGGGLFYLLFQFSKGKWIGGGDVKLGFLLGALAASPAKALLLLFIASLLGSIYALPMLFAKKAGRQSRIPFGPFLIVGAIIVVLFGTDILDAYYSLTLGVNY